MSCNIIRISHVTGSGVKLTTTDGILIAVCDRSENTTMYNTLYKNKGLNKVMPLVYHDESEIIEIKGNILIVINGCSVEAEEDNKINYKLISRILDDIGRCNSEDVDNLQIILAINSQKLYTSWSNQFDLLPVNFQAMAINVKDVEFIIKCCLTSMSKG